MYAWHPMTALRRVAVALRAHVNDNSGKKTFIVFQFALPEIKFLDS
jgi:hypothetical protein